MDISNYTVEVLTNEEICPEPMELVFKEMLMSRLEDLGGCIVGGNEKYKQYNEDFLNLFRQIMALLPDDSKQLMFRLEEAHNSGGAIFERLIYEQGIKDGMRIKDILKIA